MSMQFTRDRIDEINSKSDLYKGRMAKQSPHLGLCWECGDVFEHRLKGAWKDSRCPDCRD